MDNVPAEGTPAGDTLAVMMGLAPVVAIILGSLIKPKLFAFLLAVAVSGGIIAAGVSYALHKAPGPGTEFAAQIFGGVGGGLSLFMALATAGGRALLAGAAKPGPGVR